MDGISTIPDPDDPPKVEANGSRRLNRLRMTLNCLSAGSYLPGTAVLSQDAAKVICTLGTAVSLPAGCHNLELVTRVAMAVRNSQNPATHLHRNPRDGGETLADMRDGGPDCKLLVVGLGARQTSLACLLLIAPSLRGLLSDVRRLCARFVFIGSWSA